MTNALAIWLLVVTAGALALDHVWLHSGATLYLARKGVAFVHYLAFWR